VLSLFFIDAVEFYRKYNADGVQEKGKYALMFERSTERPALPKYNTSSKEVDLHLTPSRFTRGTSRSTRRAVDRHIREQSGQRENAERAYNLIMKDKEKLLSFDTKLKFIFSHSALREGWGQSQRLSRLRRCAIWALNYSAGRR